MCCLTTIGLAKPVLFAGTHVAIQITNLFKPVPSRTAVTIKSGAHKS